MLVPRFCRTVDCPAHHDPPDGWLARHGFYMTLAHGQVIRFRCRFCRRTCSTQTESIHFAAKRRLPMREIVDSLLEGASQREIARRYGTSPMAIHNAIIRLGRQAISAQVRLLAAVAPRPRLVFDGLRSFVTSQDYPCDLTTLIDADGETILAVTHAVFRRGGRMTTKQRRRVRAKSALWKIPVGTMSRSISRICHELWEFLRPPEPDGSAVPPPPATVDTDMHRGYRRLFPRVATSAHMLAAARVRHRCTPSTAARTRHNPLFPANYVDRLIRHRLREHTRETIAWARHSVMQTFRMWIFSWDHNTRREYRASRPQTDVHCAQGTIEVERLSEVLAVNNDFFERRIDLAGYSVPESLRETWEVRTVTPPVRWRIGQKGTRVCLPGFAQCDLLRAAA